MRAMDLAHIIIDQEMVAKIHKLALLTDPCPSNDDAETLACDLLDAALDAALAHYEPLGGLHKIGFVTKLQVAPEHSGRAAEILKAAEEVHGVSQRELIETAVVLAYDDNGTRYLRIGLNDCLRGPIARIAEAAGYDEGPEEALLETYFNPDPGTVLEACAFSMLRVTEEDITPAVALEVARVVMEEKLRLRNLEWDKEIVAAISAAGTQEGKGGKVA